MREQDTGQREVRRGVLDPNISKHGFGSKKGSFMVYLDPRKGGKFSRTLAGAPMSI